jgi:hypothetical protein
LGKKKGNNLIQGDAGSDWKERKGSEIDAIRFEFA